MDNPKSTYVPPHLRNKKRTAAEPFQETRPATPPPTKFNPAVASFTPANSSPASTNPSHASSSAAPSSSAINNIKQSSTNGKTVFGLGLKGSKWAPKLTEQELAKATTPEEAQAGFVATMAVMVMQECEALPEGVDVQLGGLEQADTLREYKKIRDKREEQAKILAGEIYKEFSASSKAGSTPDSTHSRPSSVQSAIPSGRAQCPSLAALCANDIEKTEGPAAVTAVSNTDAADIAYAPYPNKATSIADASDNDQAQATASDTPAAHVAKFQSETSVQKQSISEAGSVESGLSTSKWAPKTGAQKKNVSEAVSTGSSLDTDFSKWSASVQKKPTGCGLATDFSQWNSKISIQKSSDEARPKAVAFNTPPAAQPVAPSHLEASGESQKVEVQSIAAQSTTAQSIGVQSAAAQSTVAHSTAPPLTAVTSASEPSSQSSIEVKAPSLEVEEALIKVEAAPLEVEEAPLEVEEAPVEVQEALVEVQEAPVEFQETPLAVEEIPLLVEKTTIEVEETPLAIEEAPLVVEAAPMQTATKILLPVSITPNKPQAAVTPVKPQATAPVKLATSFAELVAFQPPLAPAKAQAPHTQTMVTGRRTGWLSKAEAKQMKAKPLSECIIDEDAYEGEIQNNDWDKNANENSAPYILCQWNGEWLPPPEDWQARNQYKKTDSFAKDVATWADRVNRHYLNLRDATSKLVVDIKSAISTKQMETVVDGKAHDIVEYKEISFENVPRSWVPDKIEGMDLQSFWQLLKQSSLEPIDDEDMEKRPYWERYLTNRVKAKGGNDFQEPLAAPDAYLDPADADVHMYRRGKSETATETLQRFEANAKEAERKKAELQQKFAKAQKKEARRPVIAPPPNPHKPAANIYLRPAFDRDLAQLVLIYNHYVNTHYSSVMTHITRDEMAAKKRAIAAANLNMIVAVQKVKQTAGQRTNLQSTQEKIVGFAFTDEHEGYNALFRYAADLEVFVHPDYDRKGVGKSLVDRMMFLADSHYQPRDAVEWRPMSDDLYLTTAGGKRSLGTVFINVYYPADEPARLSWIDCWLKQFDFKQTGRFEGGIKLRKNVNMACFVHKNYQEINPVSTRQ